MVTALGLGVLLVRGHEMGITKADFTALAAALFMCYDPLKRLGVTLTNLKSAYASLERINYLLKEPDTMPEAVDPVPMGRAAGAWIMTAFPFPMTAPARCWTASTCISAPGK